MAIKRVMGTETEYGISGGSAFSVVSACDKKGKKHFNKGKTNKSIVSGLKDHGHVGGDYGHDNVEVDTTKEEHDDDLYDLYERYGGYGGHLFGYQRAARTVIGFQPRTYGAYTCFGGSMLVNGARFYVDMGHPEYSTPECSNPRDAAIWDKAGELVVLESAKKAGKNIKIYKNNTDCSGNAYGCHENYTIKRLTEAEFRGKLVSTLVPFFVTRQLFTGSGKIGIEDPDRYSFAHYANQIIRGLDSLAHYLVSKDRKYILLRNRAEKFLKSEKAKRYTSYQLSQRADFFTELIGLQTTYNRPIINTRDEAHAKRSKYMRLHVINGDANLSEIATYLKLGTTALVLSLLEDDAIKPVKIEDPVSTFHEISRDQEYKWQVKTKQGKKTKTMPAVEIQRMYLDAAQRYRGKDKITDDILDRWESVLDALEKDPMTLDRQLDWVIKKRLIDSFRQKHSLEINDPTILNINLQYHEIDRNTSLFYYLQNNGLVDRILADEEIEHAVDNPPADTRAWFRGNVVRKFEPSSVDWSEIMLNSKRINLPEPLQATKEQTQEALENTQSEKELTGYLKKNKIPGVKMRKQRRYRYHGGRTKWNAKSNKKKTTKVKKHTIPQDPDQRLLDFRKHLR